MLMVVGTVNIKQGPILRRVWEQMTEPKWVVAFGVCASSGGFYDNYAVIQGIDQIIPGRRLHPRLPAAARAGARRPDPSAAEDRQAQDHRLAAVYRFEHGPMSKAVLEALKTPLPRRRSARPTPSAATTWPSSNPPRPSRSATSSSSTPRWT